MAKGEYVLILNPDTIIGERALEKLVAYADRYPEAGALGCLVPGPRRLGATLGYPLPTLWNLLVKSLALRLPGRLWTGFPSDAYLDWDGKQLARSDSRAGAVSWPAASF